MKTSSSILSLIVFALISCEPPKQAISETVVAPTADNSKTALDWAGTYIGKTPCADCGGIKTSLTLNPNNSYALETIYEGKNDGSHNQTGTFAWSSDGSTVVLSGMEKSGPSMYKVGENNLTQLDIQGKRIEGANASMYVLQKVNNSLLETKWELIELGGNKYVDGAAAKKPFIVLRALDNRVSGTGGCNNLMGSYTLEDGMRIKFSKIASTMMACAQGMDIEQKVAKALESTDNYTMSGDSILSLNKARMAPLVRFRRAK